MLIGKLDVLFPIINRDVMHPGTDVVGNVSVLPRRIGRRHLIDFQSLLTKQMLDRRGIYT